MNKSFKNNKAPEMDNIPIEVATSLSKLQYATSWSLRKNIKRRQSKNLGIIPLPKKET